MPFVPLGTRKSTTAIILDHDKEKLSNTMRAKDDATVTLHKAHMAGQSGYRFANHPLTMGPVRGPEAPFKTANKPWHPPEHEPDGMAALRDTEQAPIGASREGSHILFGESLRTLPKTRSLPALSRSLAANPVEEGGKTLGEQAKEAANPLSIELNRWKKLAAVTKRDQVGMPELAYMHREKRQPEPPVKTGGLVNFPKYMLFENSHLKNTEMQRYADQQARARAQAEERQKRVDEAMALGELPPQEISPTATVDDPEIHVPYASASWGQPRLRVAHETVKKQWAGSGMPAGRSQRSSNPFRMG